MLLTVLGVEMSGSSDAQAWQLIVAVVTISLSIVAIVISLLAAFPGIFGSKLDVIAQDVILIPPEGTQSVVAISPTIPFVVANRSRNDEVARVVRLQINHPDGVARTYSGVTEIDVRKLIQGANFRIKPENTLGPMQPFVLSPGNSVSKAVLFVLDDPKDGMTKNGWVEGEYQFKIEVMNGSGKSFSSQEFKYSFTAKQFKEHFSGTAIYQVANFADIERLSNN